jgi:hypothetical protein
MSDSSAAADRDIVTVLTDDHMEIDQLFASFYSANSSTKEREDALHGLIKLLSQHATAEEEVLFPFVAKTLRGGNQLVEEAKELHQLVKQTLSVIDGMSIDDPMLTEAIGILHKGVMTDATEEEALMLPQLVASSEKSARTKVGGMFIAAKLAAPTRPHPWVPNNAAANLVAGAVAAPIDRLRDLVSRR